MRRDSTAMRPGERLTNQDEAERAQFTASQEEHTQAQSIRSTINRDPSAVSDTDVSSAVEYLQKRRLLAVTDSLLMISHGAENGLDLKQGDVQAILDMASKIDATGKATPENQLTSEIESRFWEVLSHVSNIIKPASAVALRERSRFLSVKKSSVFSSTIEHYKTSVWIILLITLMLHCYYYIVGALITDAKESIKDFDLARAAAFTALATSQQQERPPSSVAINISNTCDSLKSWRSINDWIAIATLQFGSSASNSKEELIPASPAPDGSVPSTQPAKRSSELPRSDVPDDYQQLCDNGNAYITAENLKTANENLSRLKVVDDRTRKIMNWASKVRDVVGQFILPLFYGALGAITSIIRELSLSIRQIRYSRAFGFEYSLKVPLGALSGATVGLIVTPETLNTAFGLTMLGLAFGFGYSVDVFFTMPDGLIGRLTQQGVAPQGASQRNLDPAEIAVERIKRPDDRPGA